MRVFQRFQFKAVGLVHTHAVAAREHCVVHFHLAFHHKDVDAGVRLVQVIAYFLSGFYLADGEPGLLQQFGRGVAVGRYRSVPFRSCAARGGCRSPDRQAVYSSSRALPIFAGTPPVRCRCRSSRCGRCRCRRLL